MTHVTRHILSYLTCLLFAVASVSCSDDKTNIGLGSGIIDVSVVPDMNVTPVGSFTIDNSALSLPDPSDFDIIITDTEGTSALWTGVNPMGGVERLLPGAYTLKAIAGSSGAEGFKTPYFAGETSAIVKNGETTQVTINASLSNTLMDIRFDHSITDLCGNPFAIVHSHSGLYCNYTPADNGPLFLRPGDISVLLSLTLDSRVVKFNIINIFGTRAATYYRISLSATVDNDGIISIRATSADGESNTVRLTPEFLAASAPTLVSSGFTSGIPLRLHEGATPSSPLKVAVTSSSLSHLFLTAIAPTLGSTFASEIDLLNLSPTQLDSLKFYSIRVDGLKTGAVKDATVNLTDVVSHLRYVDGAYPSTFSLLAVDNSGLVSDTVVLSVEVVPVDIKVESVSKAMIGIDKATVTLSSTSQYLKDNLQVEVFDPSSGLWSGLKIDSLVNVSAGRWDVTFTVPEGREELTCRLRFCGTEISSFTVGRSAPAYRIEIDPFALHADIRINTESPTLNRIVASSIQFYRAGKSSDPKSYERIQMIERFPDEGRVVISGLEAATNYRFRSSIHASPSSSDDFSDRVSFQTEAASQIPNSDFEDVQFGGIKYKEMLSGGRYSQNTVEIYNLQNHTSFDLMTPQRWATVNNKTFCMSAKNHNTWYMAPSTYTVEDAYSGSYAVRLDCVGYDIDGAPIPDYLQTTYPYTPYSCNIPSGYSKAAGRLFLGSYSFDSASNTEHYNEGLKFNSRPAAVNGFYKFVATEANPRATALARVEVIGEVDGVEIVLASGELHLPVVLSYTAFSIPLSYNRFGTKATSIRLHFAPSDAIGDIAAESQSIIVLPNPATSTSRGSSLWLDNISLSY